MMIPEPMNLTNVPKRMAGRIYHNRITLSLSLIVFGFSSCCIAPPNEKSPMRLALTGDLGVFNRSENSAMALACA